MSFFGDPNPKISRFNIPDADIFFIIAVNSFLNFKYS